jgi:hypothetical protein
MGQELEKALGLYGLTVGIEWAAGRSMWARMKLKAGQVSNGADHESRGPLITSRPTDSIERGEEAYRLHKKRTSGQERFRLILTICLMPAHFPAQSSTHWPARISQFLRLLKLPQDIQQSVIRMGDPLPSRAITERKLRNLLFSSGPR